jgi:hypothetical protein
MRGCRRDVWRRRLRRGSAALAVASYLATIVPLPLPATESKDRSTPYPCQDRPCGCRSARECWGHCCCFTAAERIAWARSHGMEPPAYGEPGITRGWNTARLRDQEDANTAVACSRCSQRAACARCDSAETGAKHRPSNSTRGGTVAAALRCQGLTNEWSTSGAVLPPPPVTTWAPSTGVGDWLRPTPEFAPVLSGEPPEPPPRGVGS